MSDQMMKAVEIGEPGVPEALRLVERPVPSPAPGEFLIEVAAAGLNGADLAQRRGVYPPPRGASDLPGLEAAGTVSALGEGVNTPAVGTRVAALLPGGAYAGYVTTDASQVIALPDNISWTEAAGFMETAATIWSNVLDIGALEPGQRFLVHGGTSGIGTAAIQIARLSGAEVWATAGSDEKCQACRDLGATRAIPYRSESFAEALRADPAPGADVILDLVGGPYLEDNLRSLRNRGRLIVIAFNGSRKGELDLGRLMAKGLSVIGTTLRSRPLPEKARIVEGVRQTVLPWLAAGSYRVVVDSVHPLEDAARAHRAMEAGGHIGKIVLTMT